MQSRSAGDFIAENNLHRIGGYTTLALTAGTVTAGLLGLDLHPVFGLTTAAAAATTSVLGTVAYDDLLGAVWPHAVLTGAYLSIVLIL